MRPVPKIGQPATNAPLAVKVDWLMNVVGLILDNAQQDAEAIADPFTIANTTPLRIFDAQTATPTETAEVLATYLADLKRRGLNRASG